MNIWSPTGKEIKPFPQWVIRLEEENKKLKEIIELYEKRDTIMRRARDGQEGDQGDKDECPYCRFVDEGGKPSSLHGEWGTCSEERDTKRVGESGAK